jgi:hypothetical protein
MSTTSGVDQRPRTRSADGGRRPAGFKHSGTDTITEYSHLRQRGLHQYVLAKTERIH